MKKNKKFKIPLKRQTIAFYAWDRTTKGWTKLIKKQEFVFRKNKTEKLIIPKIVLSVGRVILKNESKIIISVYVGTGSKPLATLDCKDCNDIGVSETVTLLINPADYGQNFSFTIKDDKDNSVLATSFSFVANTETNISFTYKGKDNLVQNQTLPPTPQVPIVSQASATSIKISWSAINGATSYKVYRDSVLKQTVSSGTSWTETGLTTGQTYSYTIEACNAGGCSQKSNANSVTLQPNPPAKPPPPTLSQASVSSITITWNAVSGATSYNVYSGCLL